MTSQTSAKVTSPLEIVKKEESLSMDLDNLSVEKCDAYRSLMSLCHSDNIFPEHHIDLSGLWESANHTRFNENELYNYAKVLQSINQTQDQPISGIASVNIPFLQGDNDTDVSGYGNDSDSSNSSLVWETRNFIENAWNHLNETNNQTRNVIESAWHMWNETDSQIPSFGIPIREKRSIVSPQHQIQTTPIIYAKP